MSRFAKYGLIFISIFIIPTLLTAYLLNLKEFVNYASNGQMVEADVVYLQTLKRRTKGPPKCLIYYKYWAGREFLIKGDDTYSGSCPEDLRKVNIFYLKDEPEESTIGFKILGIIAPFLLVWFLKHFLYEKYINVISRDKFCILKIVISSFLIFLIITSLLLSLYGPIFIMDIFSGVIFLFLMLSIIGLANELFFYIKRLKLLRNGNLVIGKIKKVINFSSKGGDVIERKIHYQYEVSGREYGGNEVIPESYSNGLQEDNDIKLLYNPSNKYISCVDY